MRYSSSSSASIGSVRRSAGSVKVVGSQSLRAGERLSSESRRERRGLSHESRQHKDYWHAHLQPRTRRMVLTDASRSCHDSSPRPIEASSAVADDGEQRRTSVSGSRWWPLPFTRCVSLPKQDLQNLSGFLPYQLEETVAPQPRAHSPPPGRGLPMATIFSGARSGDEGQNEGYRQIVMEI